MAGGTCGGLTAVGAGEEEMGLIIGPGGVCGSELGPGPGREPAPGPGGFCHEIGITTEKAAHKDNY